MSEDINNFSSDWMEKYRIKFHHLSPGGRASLMDLITFMQETAWKHADHMGVGFSSLKEENLFFALSWESVKIQDRPGFGDVINVHTSLAGMSRLYFYRDFAITDEDSRVLLKVNTAWVCLDIESRRPQRLDHLSGEFEFPFLEKPSDREKINLSPPDEGWRQYSTSVFPSDLDANYHANNVNYVRWMIDGLPLDFFTSHDLENFYIEYEGELSCGNRLLIESNKEDAVIFHRITKKDDESEVARARSIWSPK